MKAPIRIHLPILGLLVFDVTYERRGRAIRFGVSARPTSKLTVTHFRCLVHASRCGSECPSASVYARYDMGSGVVTTAGVGALAAHTKNLSDFAYMDSGTGTNAEAIGDTALQTPAGPARVAITFTNPSTKVERSVATISYTAGLAITEWGRFSAAAAGTLLDRRKFAAINVVNGDGIQFQYDLTLPDGG